MPSESSSESQSEIFEEGASQPPPSDYSGNQGPRNPDRPHTPAGYDESPPDRFDGPIPTSAREALSKSRDEQVSSDLTSSEEQPEVDDGTLSDVLQQPIKAAGDLSEVADAAESKTTDDLARDLEAVASKAGVPTAWEMIEEILQRVRRIEEHLGIGGPEEPKAFDYLDDPSAEPHRRSGKQHPIVRTPASQESGPTGIPRLRDADN
jgi:hypothetical protein